MHAMPPPLDHLAFPAIRRGTQRCLHCQVNAGPEDMTAASLALLHPVLDAPAAQTLGPKASVLWRR